MYGLQNMTYVYNIYNSLISICPIDTQRGTHIRHLNNIVQCQANCCLRDSEQIIFVIVQNNGLHI